MSFVMHDRNHRFDRNEVLRATLRKLIAETPNTPEGRELCLTRLDRAFDAGLDTASARQLRAELDAKFGDIEGASPQVDVTAQLAVDANHEEELCSST